MDQTSLPSFGCSLTTRYCDEIFKYHDCASAHNVPVKSFERLPFTSLRKHDGMHHASFFQI